MDREYSNNRCIYRRHIIDDGWSEDMPMEIIDIIELRIQQSKKEAYNEVCRANRQHKGNWIDKAAALKYANRALAYKLVYCGQYIGCMRMLGEELQRKYGVTELEAINILNNNHIDDYVQKYYRIKNLIPLIVDEDAICESVLEEFLIAI